jgi:hypothetical protein
MTHLQHESNATSGTGTVVASGVAICCLPHVYCSPHAAMEVRRAAAVKIECLPALMPCVSTAPGSNIVQSRVKGRAQKLSALAAHQQLAVVFS